MNRDKDIIGWLIESAHGFTGTGVMLGEVVDRLNAIGFDIIRANIYTDTLHPQVANTLNVWRRGEGFVETSKTAVVVGSQEVPYGDGIVKEIHLGHRASINPAFKASPLFQVINRGRAEIRARLRPSESYEFPIFREFVDAGASDYCALELPLAEGNRGCLSWVTAREGGFDEDQLGLLRNLARIVALIVDVQSGRHTARTLLNTYLGRQPGEKVLAGKIRQGDVERIEAAIWYSDLRDYTQRSIDLSPEQLVGLLNRYFGAVGNGIAAEGGEILKFIGDAILAIFPVARDCSAHDACQAAFRASGRAREALAELNRAIDGSPLEQGVALHVGEVQYGNIGTEDRLDFTVIGDAVNLAARIEGLCSRLGHPELMSREFASQLHAPTESVGEFELKGIPHVQEVRRASSEPPHRQLLA